jgi:intraflagellar transport protein 122
MTTPSTAFNSEVEDMLCYSGTGTLCIKTGNDFPLHQQKLSGDIVGFSASKVRVTLLLQSLEELDSF